MSAMMDVDEPTPVLDENQLFNEGPESPRAESETSTLSNASTPKAKHTSPVQQRKNFSESTPIREQSSSPRKSNTPSASPRASAIPELTPKSNLLKPTASRLSDQQVMESKKKAHEDYQQVEHLKRTLSFKNDSKISPTKSAHGVKQNLGPSEHLMKTTQARISDIRELESKKDRIQPADDIWWEMRKKAQLAVKRDDVQSKLFEPTQSFLNASRDKHPHRTAKDHGSPEPPIVEQPAVVHKAVPKINAESPLLKPTRATQINAWGVDPKTLYPQESFTPHLCETGPQGVTSKLHKDTYASTINKWKSKEQIASEEAAEIQLSRERIDHGAPKVKEVSERLLTPNTNFKASMRRKSVKEEGDPREAGWQKSFVKEHIPSINEPAFASPSRRNSFSPNTTNKGRNRDDASDSGSHRSNGHSVTVSASTTVASHSTDEVPSKQTASDVAMTVNDLATDTPSVPADALEA